MAPPTYVVDPFYSAVGESYREFGAFTGHDGRIILAGWTDYPGDHRRQDD